MVKLGEIWPINQKQNRMKALLLVKEIYHEGFKNLGSILVRNYLKAFCWFSLILFAVVLYAFIFRVSTGFAFD